MSAMAPKIVDRPLAVDPKQTFESALAQVQQGRAGARSYRTPIAAGRRPGQSVEAAEKQALTDAARALARLWNVSPTLVR